MVAGMVAEPRALWSVHFLLFSILFSLGPQGMDGMTHGQGGSSLLDETPVGKDRPSCVSQVISKPVKLKRKEKPSQFSCLHFLEVVWLFED